MTRTIVNLTLPTVMSAIEDVLETYPHHPYQQAFSIPDLRQELVAHVLSRIPNCYVAVDDKQTLSLNYKFLACSMQEESCIEALIHQGIEKILRRREQELAHQIPEEVEVTFAPSHWFG